MIEVSNKKINNIINEYFNNLVRDKNDYVIEGNFDYLKKNNLLCISIFRGDDYVYNIQKKLSEFVIKRNEKKCFIINKFWNKDKNKSDTKVFKNKDLSELFFDTIIEKLNLTIFGFFFFKSNLFIIFNDFDYYLIIGKKEDIEELTGLTMLKLLEYTKEIDWYSDDSPEMYETYKKFFEEMNIKVK